MTQDDLTARLAAMEAQLTRIEQAVEAMGRRLDTLGAHLKGRVGRLANAQSIYLGDHTALTFLESGQRLYVDTRSRDIGNHLLSLGRWESGALEAFRRLVKPGHCVLDLGANHGFYSLHAAKLTGPTGRVEAFEPNPRLAELARGSLSMNGYRWARLHALAVGDRPGRAMLTLDEDMPGGGFIREAGLPAREKLVPVSVVALDEMFSDPAFTVDVVKMDIEGYEARALRGMTQLLQRSPGVCLLLEFAPQMLAQAGTDAADLIGQCQALGFSAWGLNARGELSPLSWEALLAETGGIQNILVSRQIPY